MKERVQLDFIPCLVAPFQQSVAEWGGVTRGLYWLLLMRQWQEGFIPCEEERLARILSVSVKEIRRHWPDISQKFERRTLPDGREVLVNARCEAVYQEQLARFLRRCRVNAENGKGGGRPKKETKTEPKENPVGFDSDTDGNPQANRNETRRNPNKNKNKNKSISSVSNDTGVPQAETLEELALDLSSPFGKAYGCLWLVHRGLQMPPPPYEDAKKHLRGSTRLLALVDSLGLSDAAKLIVFCWTHRAGGVSIAHIYEQRAALYKQMHEGVPFVPRQTDKPRRQSLAAAMEEDLF